MVRQIGRMLNIVYFLCSIFLNFWYLAKQYTPENQCRSGIGFTIALICHRHSNGMSMTSYWKADYFSVLCRTPRICRIGWPSLLLPARFRTHSCLWQDKVRHFQELFVKLGKTGLVSLENHEFEEILRECEKKAQFIWLFQINSIPLHSLFDQKPIRKIVWRDGRVVDYTGLENRRTERYRGFESLSLR